MELAWSFYYYYFFFLRIWSFYYLSIKKALPQTKKKKKKKGIAFSCKHASNVYKANSFANVYKALLFLASTLMPRRGISIQYH